MAKKQGKPVISVDDANLLLDVAKQTNTTIVVRPIRTPPPQPTATGRK